MRRILLEIPLPFGWGALPIYGYGLMLVLGFLAGLALSVHRGRRRGIQPTVITDLALYCLLAGIVGARIAYLFLGYEADPLAAHPLLDLIAIWKGGLVFQGGLVFALGVVIWYLASRRLPAGKLADIFAPGIALGVAIGRIGCFLNGCCFGRICPPAAAHCVTFPGLEHPQGPGLVFFHHYSLMEAGELVPRLRALGYPPETFGSLTETALPLPVYPTQLYAAGAMLVVCLLLLAIDRLPKRFPGMLMTVFLMLYSAQRFVVEFWRDDTPYWFGWGDFPGFHFGQLAGIAVFLAALGFLLYRLAGGAGPEAEPPSSVEPHA